MEGKRGRDTKRQRDKETERVRAPSQAVTEQALPKGRMSLESSQLGESQAALEIWGREGGLGESSGVCHCPLSPKACVPAAMLLRRPLVAVHDHC